MLRSLQTFLCKFKNPRPFTKSGYFQEVKFDHQVKFPRSHFKHGLRGTFSRCVEPKRPGTHDPLDLHTSLSKNDTFQIFAGLEIAISTQAGTKSELSICSLQQEETGLPSCQNRDPPMGCLATPI